MKPNKLTPGANVMWESSRFMLPELVEALQLHHKESKRKQRPEFDAQQLEEFSRMICDYISSDVMLYIVIFGEYEDKDYHAKITKIDPPLRRMMLEWMERNEEQYEWVRIDDIIDMFT